ncbi:hypothetical protein I7I51_03405 [Histoplasma capsulatum]|uniref:Uncharacterized protein n=1 Tax=Ajellomyces capsulatus TaxID=5037 RepID=A0A8A1M920_AJECA|nr:hypothetical protein I7I51_03405 [Histoplasma capsulatum]
MYTSGLAMELLFVANTLGRECCSCFRSSPKKRARYTSWPGSEGHELQRQEGQDQGFRGQGAHLSAKERSGQGHHFRQAKMKMEPRYQMSAAERAKVGLALNHQKHDIPQQADPAPAQFPMPTEKGNKGSGQVRGVPAATNSQQSDPSTSAATREPGTTVEQTNASRDAQSADALVL